MSGTRWTEKELAVLYANWEKVPNAELADMLPGRDTRSVRSKRSALGLVRDRSWTDKDERKLQDWYKARHGGPLRLEALASELGRGRANVSRKARSLGLTETDRVFPRKDRRKFKGDNEAYLAHLGASTKQRIKDIGHPRGMLGKKKSKESIRRSVAGHAAWLSRQSPEELSAITLRSTQTRIDKYGTAAPGGFMDGSSNPYSRAKRGRREDLGNTFFRSRWEANYARFLNLLVEQRQIQKWEYEPDTFWFEAIRRGVRSYTPDFKVWENDEGHYYVEVKGWMDAKSKTKLKRMKKYHPEVEVRLFEQKAYRELERKLGAAIAGWEK